MAPTELGWNNGVYQLLQSKNGMCKSREQSASDGYGGGGGTGIP